MSAPQMNGLHSPPSSNSLSREKELHLSSGITDEKPRSNSFACPDADETAGFEAKICVLGNAGSGKSSFVKSLTQRLQRMPLNHTAQDSSINNNNNSINSNSISSSSPYGTPLIISVDRQPVRLSLWEFETRRILTREDEERALGCSLICVVAVDLRDREEIVSDALEKWLSLCQQLTFQSLLVVVGTFGDALPQRRMGVEAMAGLSRKKGAIYIEASALTPSDMLLFDSILVSQIRNAVEIRNGLLATAWDDLLDPDNDADNVDKLDSDDTNISNHNHSGHSTTHNSHSFSSDYASSSDASSPTFIPALEPVVMASAIGSFLASFVGIVEWMGVDYHAIPDQSLKTRSGQSLKEIKEADMLAADATARKIEKLFNSINTSTTSLSTTASDGGCEGVKDASASDLQSELLTFIDESDDYMKNIDRFDSAEHLSSSAILPATHFDSYSNQSLCEIDTAAALEVLGLDYLELSRPANTSLDLILTQKLPFELTPSDAPSSRPMSHSFSSINSSSANKDALNTSLASTGGTYRPFQSQNNASNSSFTNNNINNLKPSSSNFAVSSQSDQQIDIQNNYTVSSGNNNNNNVNSSSNPNDHLGSIPSPPTPPKSSPIEREREKEREGSVSVASSTSAATPGSQVRTAATALGVAGRSRVGAIAIGNSSAGISGNSNNKTISSEEARATKACVLNFQIPPTPGREVSESISVRVRPGDSLKALADELCSQHRISYLKDALLDKMREVCL